MFKWNVSIKASDETRPGSFSWIEKVTAEDKKHAQKCALERARENRPGYDFYEIITIIEVKI